MRRLLFPVLGLVLATSCSSQEAMIGSGNDELTSVSCDQCDATTYPANLVCPQGAKAGCYKKVGGTCGWASKCPGDSGGTDGGGGGSGDPGTPGACAASDCGPQPAIGACIQCGDPSSCGELICRRQDNGKCAWKLGCPGGTGGTGTADAGVSPGCPPQPKVAPCPSGSQLTTSTDASGCPVTGCSPIPDAGTSPGACSQSECGAPPTAVPAICLVCADKSCGHLMCTRKGDGKCTWGLGCSDANPDAGVAPKADAGSCPKIACAPCPKGFVAAPADKNGCPTCQCVPATCGPSDCGPMPAIGACLQCGDLSGACGGGFVCKQKANGTCGWSLECPNTTASKWYYTCGDPVCRGYTAGRSTAAKCTAQKVGSACTPEGATCDPQDSCNRMLVCASTNPVKAGGCPISRRETKQDIRYLDGPALAPYRDELLRMKLATWRYKFAPAKERLGFIIDDNPGSVSVDSMRDMVDLYGYTSLAVATLQMQAREIAELKKQVRALQGRTAAHPGQRAGGDR